MPMQKHTTATAPEDHTTARKLLKIRMEVNAGKMIRLEIIIAPIICIPSTMVTAVSTAINILYADTLTPVALAKLSSKVTAKILS